MVLKVSRFANETWVGRSCNLLCLKFPGKQATPEIMYRSLDACWLSNYILYCRVDIQTILTGSHRINSDNLLCLSDFTA